MMSHKTFSPAYRVYLFASHWAKETARYLRYWPLGLHARFLLRRGKCLDAVIGLLRRKGMSQTESSDFLQRQLGMSYEHAKTATFHSPVWKDELGATLALHDELETLANMIILNQQSNQQPKFGPDT
jgi:hypothetical protein